VSIQSTDNIYFFESQKDIEVSGPYAILSAEVLAVVIQRFVSWAEMSATHPDLAESFGEASTAHIKLATDLRIAVKKSRQENTYPNVVLPAQKFKVAMTLMRLTSSLELECGERIAGKSQKWETDFPS